MKYQKNGKLAHNVGKELARKLKLDGYSRDEAREFMLNKGVSDITTKRALRFVYGAMKKRGRPRKITFSEPVKSRNLDFSFNIVNGRVMACFTLPELEKLVIDYAELIERGN